MKKQYKRFILVLDDFHEDPYEVRYFALSLNYYEVANATGFRSDKLYNDSKLKKRPEGLLNIKITNWGKYHDSENGIFFLAFSKGKIKEKPAIHTDPLLNDITVVIYLTPRLPPDCGTSFWRHKKTALCDEPAASDAARLKIPIKELREIFDNDVLKRAKWEELDRVAYKSNRMIAFPSGVFIRVPTILDPVLKMAALFKPSGLKWTGTLLTRDKLNTLNCFYIKIQGVK